MNKKRLLAAALLLSMPLLSGCSSMVSERAMEDISALTIEVVQRCRWRTNLPMKPDV